MKPTKEQIDAYKAMAKTSPDSMKAKIEANLKATCDKYAGHEDLIDDCIKYLTACAKEILGGKNGEVNNETCYRICRDYFNDEIWAKEDQEKAEAQKKSENIAKKAKKEKTAKKAPKMTAAQVEKEAVEKENARIEKLKEKHGLKQPEEPKPEPEKPKFQVCPECGKEFLNLYHGVCLTCYEKKHVATASEAVQDKTATMKPEPGQLDFFALMVV